MEPHDMNKGTMTAAQMGKKGGKARVERMTPEELSKAGYHAAMVRWHGRKKHYSTKKAKKT